MLDVLMTAGAAVRRLTAYYLHLGGVRMEGAPERTRVTDSKFSNYE